MDSGPLSADEFRDRLRGRRLDDPAGLTDEDDTVVLVEADDAAGVATRRDVGSKGSAGIATRRDEPRPPLGPPGTGGGWLAGSADLTELDDGGFAPAGPTGEPVPPPPDGLDDLRDDAVVDAATDAAGDESLVQRAIDDLADLWDDGRTSAGSGRGAIDDAPPSADDVAGYIAPGAPAEAEERVPTEGPDTTPPTRPAMAGSRDDPPTSADAAVLQTEVLARLSHEETRLALTPRRALELVKDAAWAAQEARERAARAEGEASVLRYELERLRMERAELTALLAETRHRWLSRRR